MEKYSALDHKHARTILIAFAHKIEAASIILQGEPDYVLKVQNLFDESGTKPFEFFDPGTSKYRDTKQSIREGIIDVPLLKAELFVKDKIAVTFEMRQTECQCTSHIIQNVMLCDIPGYFKGDLNPSWEIALAEFIERVAKIINSKLGLQ